MAVDAHPTHRCTYLPILSHHFAVGASNAIAGTGFSWLLSRGLGAGTVAQAAAPQRGAMGKPRSTAQPQPSQSPVREIPAHSGASPRGNPAPGSVPAVWHPAGAGASFVPMRTRAGDLWPALSLEVAFATGHGTQGAL